MSKVVKYQRYLAYYEQLPEYSSLSVDTASKSKFVTVDDESGQYIIFKGEHFKYDGGFLVSGKIEEFSFTTDQGEPTIVDRNTNIDAGSITGETLYEYAFNFLLRLNDKKMDMRGTSANDASLYAGNADDKIDGRKGDDDISGGGGDDRLTGGAGSDTFSFSTGAGKDVITDFDADGGDGHQDFIDADYPGELAIQKSGKHDTLIDFGDGDTLKLLDVKPGQIDATDFV